MSYFQFYIYCANLIRIGQEMRDIIVTNFIENNQVYR